MRDLARAVGVVATVASALSCGGSSTQTVTSPSTTKCQVTAVAEPAAFAAAGGTGTLTVTTNRDCLWNAAASGNWIQLADASSGQGNGQVAFSVATNPDPSQRRGAITISDQQVAISQDAAQCTFTVSPLNDSVSPEGERRTINVTANIAQCSWSARTETEWLTIVQGSQGSGNGQVVYEARRTPGPSRSGELTIAGQRVIVTQGGCQFSISPESYSVTSAGGSGAVAVTTVAGCEWTATSNAPWITITTGGTRSGNGSVPFAVAANTGPARSGTLNIAGRTFTVSQSSGCTFSISPTAQAVPSHGGPGSVTVSTSLGCAWTAKASVPWARITSGQSGTGPGTVAFTVDGTPSSLPRSATLSIAGQTFTINQDGAPCVYVLSPPSVVLEAAGGSGAFEVNTPEGCTWTAGSNDAWLRVTAGPSGSGDGTVSFSADANPGPPRTGTIVAGGRIFTASQAGAALTLAQRHNHLNCTASVDPSNAFVDAAPPPTMSVTRSK